LLTQYLLLFKPIIYLSNFTRVVFIPVTAEPALTTEYWLSDMDLLMERITIKLKTPGELLGDRVDTFTLNDREMEKESAESRWPLRIQLLDRHIPPQPFTY
jgi:hypothetical protein